MSRPTRVTVKETGIMYDSQVECAKALGAHSSHVANHLRGRAESVKGFHLEYTDIKEKHTGFLDAEELNG